MTGSCVILLLIALSFFTSATSSSSFSSSSSSFSSSSSSSSNCLATTAKGVYDFSPLGDRDYVIRQTNFDFVLNPCVPLKSVTPVGTACPSGSFACQVNSGTLTAAYTVATNHTGIAEVGVESFKSHLNGGTYCSGNGNYRAMTISYYCGAGEGQPVYSSESACHFYFNWATKYACDVAHPPLSSYEELLEALIEGHNVKVVYDFKLCSNRIDAQGGATIENFSSYGSGEDSYIEFSDSRVGQQKGKFFNIVEEVKILASHEVVIFTSFLDLRDGGVISNTTVTCPFGGEIAGARFLIN